MKNRELIEKARADAINRANSGAVMTEAEMRLANLNQEGVDKLALAPFKLSAAKSEASKLETEAAYAPKILDADLAFTRARTVDALRPPTSSGSGSGTGGKPPSLAQDRLALNSLKQQVKDAFVAGDTFAKNKYFAEAERKFNETGAAIAAYNIIAARRGLPPIGKPGTSKAFNEYVAKNGMPSGRGKAAVTGGQARPAGVGPDWKLEKDSKGNKAWVNPSRTKFVETR
jgi:hypothetical protein